MAGIPKLSRMAAYLNKVRQGLQINYTVLVKLLERDGYSPSWIQQTFTAELVKRDCYRVRIKNEEAFSELWARYSEASYSSRISAASAGDSHRSRVSGSFLLVRSIQFSHPQVILCSDHDWKCPIVLNAHALIVENLESFLALEQTLTFAVSDCGMPVEIGDVDLIFGQGNSITNSLNRSFLREYQSISCLFDADLGGVKMFSSLLEMIGDRNIHFLLPENIKDRLTESSRALSSQDRADLSRYAGRHLDLDRTIQVLRATGCTLEQETYL
ncbi:MAG: hypothetical protein ACPGMR_00155 [Pontibacterium sp.]